MAIVAYRVRKPFQWDVWQYAPNPGQSCQCGPECLNDGIDCRAMVASGCICRFTSCRCTCGIAAEQYAGDIWFVEDGNTRKDIMLANRFAVYDASLPAIDELMKGEIYRRILQPPPPVVRRMVLNIPSSPSLPELPVLP